MKKKYLQLPSSQSTGTVYFPHKFQPGLYRDCTGTVQGLYRDCATTAKTRRTPVPSSLLLAGASAQATPLPLLPHVHYTDGDRHGRNVCVPLVPTRTFRNETQLRDTAAYPGRAKGGARLHGRLGKLRATSDRQRILTHHFVLAPLNRSKSAARDFLIGTQKP